MELFDLKPITTENVITIGIALSVIVGWWFKVWQDRKFDKYRRAMDKREKALESVLPILLHVSNTGSLDHKDMENMLRAARTQIQLYGDAQQIEKYEDFIKSIESKDLENLNKSLFALRTVIVNSIRKDKDLPALKF